MNITRTLSLAILLLWALIGCTVVRPALVPDRKLKVLHTFSHEDFDLVLANFVNDHGLVNYRSLKKDTHNLERYYLLLSTYSPESHPNLFPTEQSKLTYWINAYNAAAIKIVLAYYPITSVKNIKPPFPLFFLPDKSGFFLFQRLVLGGRSMSLYSLENKIIRKRFGDPRIHFVLNCASGGCPRLPRRAFTAQYLNKQLNHETRKFLAEERNLRLDHQKKTIFLSSIFNWYRGDFLQWYRSRYPERKATLLDYVSLYLPPEKAQEIMRYSNSYRLSFVPYDWHLNDQLPPA
jgi:hypothetical protein